MAAGITIAFDIYGTLADTGGVARALEIYCKDARDAAAFAARWRDKQLEYTFRRTAMGCYADFGQCTAEALLFVCAERGIRLDDSQRRQLSAEYSVLPLFADAKPALLRLRDNGGIKMFAFSNGKAAAVKEWLRGRDILEYFADIISADEVREFKPSPRVYNHFLHRAKGNAADADNVYLVSGNPFDIIGAQHIGIKGLWLNRTGKAAFDPWRGITPAKTITSLATLADMFAPEQVKREQLKIGAFVRENIPGIFTYCEQNPKELSRLMDADYSKRQFGAAFPFCLEIANIPLAQAKGQQSRYWSRHYVVCGKTVRVTNYWYHWQRTDFANYLNAKQIPIVGADSPSVGQPVKIHVFIDLENDLAKEELGCLLAEMRKQSGLSMTGKAFTANAAQKDSFKTWNPLFNHYGIEKIEIENPDKDAVDAAIVGDVALATLKQKTGDIICIIGTDQIYSEPARGALKRGFRVIRFGKAKPSWTTKTPNYRFFDINETIEGKSKFPEEWKTRPAAKK